MTVWASAVPKKDNFNQLIKDEFIDGKTHYGPWAIMTPASHRTHGVGIGLGKGQKYRKDASGVFVKVGG